MKISKNLFAFSLAVCGFSTVSLAQNPTIAATATATATIVATLTITKTVDMSFGSLGVNTNLGTAVLSVTGGRTSTGGVSIVPGGTVPAAAASFDLVGEPGYAYTFDVPTTNTAVTLTNTTGSGAETMTADTWTSSLTNPGTLSSGGLATITVGATLHVGASQVPGVYVSGTPFTVTVHYN